METQKTQTALAVVMPNLLGNIDFSTLNSAIDKLANANTTLDEESKKMAVEVINNWNSSVINKLTEKNNEVDNFITSLNPASNYMYLEEDQLEAMALSTGAKAQYDAYIAKLEELRILEENRPEEFVPDLTTTYEEQLTARRDFDLEYAKYDIKHSKTNKQIGAALKELKIKLNEAQEVKDMLTKMRKFKRNVNSFKTDCNDRAQLAKLNVSIESEEVRAALRELLDFNISL